MSTPLDTYDSSRFRSSAGQALLRDAIYQPSSSQRWQKSYDLDGFLVLDKDVGLERPFSGILIDTDTSMPTVDYGGPTTYTQVENVTISATGKVYRYSDTDYDANFQVTKTDGKIPLKIVARHVGCDEAPEASLTSGTTTVGATRGNSDGTGSFYLEAFDPDGRLVWTSNTLGAISRSLVPSWATFVSGDYAGNYGQHFGFVAESTVTFSVNIYGEIDDGGSDDGYGFIFVNGVLVKRSDADSVETYTTTVNKGDVVVFKSDNYSDQDSSYSNSYYGEARFDLFIKSGTLAKSNTYVESSSEATYRDAGSATVELHRTISLPRDAGGFYINEFLEGANVSKSFYEERRVGFVVGKAGTLTVTVDEDPGFRVFGTSKDNSATLYINGEEVWRVDEDIDDRGNEFRSFTRDLNEGDVVIANFGYHFNSNKQQDADEEMIVGFSHPATIHFTGEAVRPRGTKQMTFKDYCMSILGELYMMRNGTNAIIPVCIKGDDEDRVKVALSAITACGCGGSIAFDLYLNCDCNIYWCSDAAGEDTTYYVEYLHVATDHNVRNLFNFDDEDAVKELYLYRAERGGQNGFRHINKLEIGPGKIRGDFSRTNNQQTFIKNVKIYGDVNDCKFNKFISDSDGVEYVWVEVGNNNDFTYLAPTAKGFYISAGDNNIFEKAFNYAYGCPPAIIVGNNNNLKEFCGSSSHKQYFDPTITCGDNNNFEKAFCYAALTNANITCGKNNNFQKFNYNGWKKSDGVSKYFIYSENGTGNDFRNAFDNAQQPFELYFCKEFSGNSLPYDIAADVSKSNLAKIAQNSNCRYVYINSFEAPVSLQKAFSNCENLTEAYLSICTGDIDLSECFYDCVNLKYAYFRYDGIFPKFTRMFYNCSSLESLLESNDTGPSQAPKMRYGHYAYIDHLDDVYPRDIDMSYMFYNCYKVVRSHNDIKNFLDKYYEHWVNGEEMYRKIFFNCPYNGTIHDSIMSFSEQLNVGFKPEKLMYEALKANINSNDAGYFNIHHEDSPWSEYVSDFITYEKPHTIKAVSHQLDESSAAAFLEVDGKIVQTFSTRGHLIGVYDCKTMSIKYYDWTDTYAYEIKKTSVESIWANALSIAGPTDIIYVLSFDATTRSDSARNSCLSVGGHTGYGTWGATRYAHALIGKVGLGANNGYESINNGGSASVVEAKFTSDGLVCSTWSDSGKNHLYEPDSSFTYEHPREFYKVEVPAEEYWRWKYLLKNMKSLWDSCSFTFTDTNTADFTLSVKTTGADAEINPNSSLSINYELKNYSSPDFYWHIGKIENVSDKDVSIKRIFANTENIHCVECDFINIDDISYAFYQCGQFDHIIAKMHGCTIAQYTFAECANIKTIEAVSDTITDAQFMCYNCPELVTYDLVGMTALKDATSMFEKCPSLSTEQFKQNTKLPDCLEIAKRMFAECSITEIEGNWVPRNASSSFQNYTEISHGYNPKDWENRLEKDGWSFPSHLYSAYQMFEGNPIKKISYLKLNEKADNSWLFQNCSELTTIDFSYLNVDAYDNGKYTGIFDGCSLKKDNVIWLPISISSDFDLAHTGIKYGKNEAPTLFWVDDYWCEVDHSGFVEYQHIRRPAYEKVYKEHYGDILIKFWSHPHVHSAEMRGYNELHDTTVWYDKDSYGHGIYPTSWEDN